MIRILRMVVVATSWIAFAAGAQTPQAKNGISAVSPSTLLDMVDKLDKLDQLDQQDFLDALGEAEACTRLRKFSCSELRITKAAKLANGSKDQLALLAARQNITNEKTRMAEEERLRVEEDRRLAEAEERLRLAQAKAAQAAQREQEDNEPSAASQLFQLGSMIARNYQTNKAVTAMENAARSQAFNNMQAQVQAGIARDQQRFAEQKAQIAAARQTREKANASAARPATTGSPPGGVAPIPATQMTPVTNPSQSKSQQFARATPTTNPEHERDARADNERWSAHDKAAELRPELPKHQPQVVTIPSDQKNTAGRDQAAAAQTTSVATSTANTSKQTEPINDPNPYLFDLNWRQVGEAAEPTREVSCRKATTSAQSEMASNAAGLNTLVTLSSTACVCVYSTASGYYPQWRCMIYAQQKHVRKHGPSDGVSK